LGSVEADAQTILPYGDSVTTFGADPESSYRYWLYKDLTDAGFNFSIIGTRSGVEDGAPANPWPEEGYSGHEGWSSVDASDPANLNPVVALSPDIVLLDFGSNDILQGLDLTATTEVNLETIIQAFANQNSSVTILIAKPTGFVPDPAASKQEQRREKSQQSKLAGIVGRVAKTEKKAGINVIAVDQKGGFNVKRNTIDGSHPNVLGEQKIANKYFKALKKIL
jgi:lysophospholipase L1-like esterase